MLHEILFSFIRLLFYQVITEKSNELLNSTITLLVVSLPCLISDKLALQYFIIKVIAVDT